MARGKMAASDGSRGTGRRRPGSHRPHPRPVQVGVPRGGLCRMGSGGRRPCRHLRPRPDAAGPRLRLPGKRACRAGTAGDLPGPGRQGTKRMAAGSCRLHRPAILRRHECPHRPHGGTKHRLGRHLPRRPDRHRAGGPSGHSDRTPGHQRHRPGGAARRPLPDQPVRGRHAGSLRFPRRCRALPARGPGTLRERRGRALAAPHRDTACEGIRSRASA